MIGWHRSNDEFQWYLSPKDIKDILNVLPSKTRAKYQHIWNTRNITGITQDEANGIALLIDICYQYKKTETPTTLIVLEFVNQHKDIDKEPLMNRFYYLIDNKLMRTVHNPKSSFDNLKYIFK
ncbi:MAG: hypothetical protein KAS12_01295 [Candidatus Aenigmarchaeota archaeon]|nr:hypothetical protein [Candidatus Aenigmarchaeota archaeon]